VWRLAGIECRVRDLALVTLRSHMGKVVEVRPGADYAREYTFLLSLRKR
jgi:hypothetical protein